MLTVRQLGKKGRFANQIFQYAHLRQKAGADYECPPWIGNDIFGLKDTGAVSPASHDIGTRFPQHSSWYDKALFERLFRPLPSWTVKIDEVIRRLREAGTLVGIHLRRGDYGTFRRQSAKWCFIAPAEWYAQCLRDNEINAGVLFVASDDPNINVSEFMPWNTYKHPNTDFWWDFYTLTQCDVLLISNSTFSFAASMLNTRAYAFYRPRLGKRALIPYDPWNSPIVFKDEHYA